MRIAFTLLLLSCTTPKTEDTQVSTVQEDADGDGFGSAEDCDDSNPLIMPGGDEICDGIDNNCDGQIDENVRITFYADSDGDGFGNPNIINEACEQPSGYSPNGSDCDDGNNQSYPSAEEICDGEDNDCNEEIDEGLSIDFYVDNDGDGFGSDDEVVSSCQASIGLATIGGDCDDTNITVSPFGTEYCDGIDNNCDGQIDEGVQTTYYLDFDTDGFGDPNTVILSCEPVEGYVLNDDDCMDTDTQSYPNAPEFCDNTDNNCDGVVDEDTAFDAPLWYADMDTDGFGTVNLAQHSCIQPNNYVANSLDCNDSNNNISPNASEVCNGEDDNCNGIVDEDSAIDAQLWYADFDADGFGQVSQTTNACTLPVGYSANSLDCDDYDNDTHPNASEMCNGEDDNCDGVIDEHTAANATIWYADTDSDGFGDSNVEQASCTQPIGFVLEGTDCDDSNDNIHPNVFETCNETDDNCNGDIDEYALDRVVFYEDSDGDGYGALSQFVLACSVPDGYLSNASDCDDSNASVHPLTDELCNSIDDNCDGIVDEHPVDAGYWFVDADQDSYGSVTSVLQACTQPTGYVSNASDCDDIDELVNLEASEVCNDKDDNCDGQIDEGLLGLHADCPVESCLALIQDEPSTVSGSYWLDPDGAGSVEAYCNMTIGGGGWTLVAKLTNQDAKNWSSTKITWTDTNVFGTTSDLSIGADAKSELWGRLVATDILLNDHLHLDDYVYTDDSCIGSLTLSSYFTTALASFPYSGTNYYDACAVQFSYVPNWGTEPDWGSQTASSSQIGLNNSSTIAIAKTDNGADTSGVISFYEASDPFEADVGLGALETGTSFTSDGYSQDIGGPTSCDYIDTQCASEYPETVFFWAR